MSFCTRGQRPGEHRWCSSHITSQQKDEFLDQVNQGGFIEYALKYWKLLWHFASNRKTTVSSRTDVLLEIDCARCRASTQAVSWNLNRSLFYHLLQFDLRQAFI